MKHDAEKILKVLIYIEDNFQDDVSIEKLAKIACYSPFHFQRLFRFIVGESVYQYIQQVRLTQAADKLRNTKQGIAEIALDAKYRTSSAFTKAFKQCMGRNPRNYRLLYQEIAMSNDKLSALSMIEPTEIKIIKDIPVLYIRRVGNYESAAREAWSVLAQVLEKNKLADVKLRHFSVLYDDPKIVGEEHCRIDACIDDDPRIPLEGELARKTLPGGKYAIFTYLGDPTKMTETIDRIFLKWLPDSNQTFDLRRVTIMEHPNVLTTKIYIPVV